MIRIRCRSPHSPNILASFADLEVVHVDEHGAETPLREVTAVTWRCSANGEPATATLEVRAEVEVSGELEVGLMTAVEAEEVCDGDVARWNAHAIAREQHEHTIRALVGARRLCDARVTYSHGPGPCCSLYSGHRGDHVAIDFATGNEIDRW